LPQNFRGFGVHGLADHRKGPGAGGGELWDLMPGAVGGGEPFAGRGPADVSGADEKDVQGRLLPLRRWVFPREILPSGRTPRLRFGCAEPQAVISLRPAARVRPP
jgi:hypothetical protein